MVSIYPTKNQCSFYALWGSYRIIVLWEPLLIPVLWQASLSWPLLSLKCNGPHLRPLVEKHIQRWIFVHIPYVFVIHILAHKQDLVIFSFLFFLLTLWHLHSFFYSTRNFSTQRKQQKSNKWEHQPQWVVLKYLSTSNLESTLTIPKTSSCFIITSTHHKC